MSAAVRLAAVSYRYPDGRLALDGVGLEIEAGERVALLGPNGAGKTTLLHHLNGLLRGDGIAEVAGLAVEKRTLRALRARVGLVFQDPDDQLFMPTVGEDVAFGPLNLGVARDELATRVAGALADVRMQDAGPRAPHQLSMGERRRVAIATVLASRPEILALDEPSANLDPRSRRDLVEVLAAFPRTLVVATHDLPLAAELCERAVVVDAGRVVADAPCEEVLGDEALLAAHDLLLPPGFDPGRVVRRPLPTAR